MAHWGMAVIVMAVGGGISLAGAGSGSHTVEYVVDVRGEFRGELYVRYVDSDDRLVTETLAAPSWRERVEVSTGLTDEVRVLATLAPAAGEAGPEPAVSCGIVVDGVERVRETGARVVTCRFDLAGLTPTSSPSPAGPGNAGDGTGSAVLWSSAGVAVLLAAAAAAVWWWRSRAPAPAGGPEPHVRFMAISGAIAVAIAVGGFFVACNAPPTAPPGLDVERGLP